MHSLFDTYLSRLTHRLSRRWPESKVADAVGELREHLAESRQSLLDEGLTPDSAMFEALRRLGSDRLLAENLIRADSGIEQKSIWRLAWLPVASILVFTALPNVLDHLDPTLFELVTNMITWVSFVAVASFVWVIWRSRRVLFKPVLAALGASALFGLIYAVSFGITGFSATSKAMRDENLAGFDRYIEQLEGREAAARSAMNGGELPKSGDGRSYDAPAVSVVANFESAVPYLPISRESSRKRIVALAPTASATTASELWKANGAEYLRGLAVEMKEQQGYRGYWQRFKPTWGVVREVGIADAAFILIGFAFLMSVNAVVLGLVRLRLAIIGRLWRPEALS
jgi:hypothetical protein